MPTDVVSSATEVMQPEVPAPAGGDPRTSASVRTPIQKIVDRETFIWRRLEGLIGSFLPLSGNFPVAASISGNNIIINGHGLSNNDPIRMWAIASLGGVLPTPLQLGIIYYAVVIDSNTFQLASVPSGSAITLTSVGGGPIFASRQGAFTVPLLNQPNVFGNVQNQFLGSIAIAHDLTVDGDATVEGNTTLEGTLTLIGQLLGNLSVSGNVTIGGNLTTGGSYSPAIVNPSSYYGGAFVDQNPLYTGAGNQTWTIGDPGTTVTSTTPAPSGQCNQIISPVIRFPGWGQNGAGHQQLTVNLLPHVGSDSPTMEIIFDPADPTVGGTPGGPEIVINDQGTASAIFYGQNSGTLANAVAGFSGSGSVKVAWKNGVAWRVVGFTGFFGLDFSPGGSRGIKW